MENRKAVATEPDVTKVCAVLTVMMQGLLNYMIKQPFLDASQKAGIGVLFDLVRFSPAAFIFAICFDLAKIKSVNYGEYLWAKFKECLAPYLAWTAIYICTINFSSYKSLSDIGQAVLFGTAAGHLWYAVMMFQFHLLIIPIVWLANKMRKNSRISVPVLCITLAAYLFFLYLYDTYALYSNNKYLRFTDRTFLMYSIYCVFGMVVSVNYGAWKKFLYRFRYFLIPLFFLAFITTNNELLAHGGNGVNFINATVLKPSMLAYNIIVIMLICALALALMNHNSRLLPFIKWLSTYAFRAYLANIFCLNFAVWMLGRTVRIMPLGMAIVILWAATAAFSFTLVYLVHLVYIKIRGKKRREIR